MKYSTVVLLGGWLLLGASVLGHPGPRIWVSVDNGRVTTYAGPYPPGTPANYHPSSVFTQSLNNEGDDVWGTDFPGFQKVPGGSISNGTTFRYNITGPVLWYNPGDGQRCPYFETVVEAFADSPPVPQLAVTNELFQTRYSSIGFVVGDAAFAYNGSAGDHNHLTYTLLGDGLAPGGGPNGVYALPLQLTATGAVTSSPFFLLLGKNASAAVLAEAADVISHPRVAPDLDCDGDVDLEDHALFDPCMLGPGFLLPPFFPSLEYCSRVDTGDDDVDLVEFSRVQRCFSGTGAADPDCAD